MPRSWAQRASRFITGIAARTYDLIQSMSTALYFEHSRSATSTLRTLRAMLYELRLPSSSCDDVKSRGPTRLPASSASRISVLGYTAPATDCTDVKPNANIAAHTWLNWLP